MCIILKSNKQASRQANIAPKSNKWLILLALLKQEKITHWMVQSVTSYQNTSKVTYGVVDKPPVGVKSAKQLVGAITILVKTPVGV